MKQPYAVQLTAEERAELEGPIAAGMAPARELMHARILLGAFAPAEAKRPADKLAIHYTPTHGSWLSMAAIELSVLCRPGLDRRLPDVATPQTEVTAWQARRPAVGGRIDRRFTTADARIKPKRLYPECREVQDTSRAGDSCMWDRIYLVITGAGTARRTPELARALAALGPPVLCVPTANAARVVSLHELWQALPREGGHGVVDSYFDDGLGMPAAPGLVLVAPCDFNSLNKLAQGIADSLALSIAADGIGAGWPVLAAISMNRGLWQHPRTRISIGDLAGWGVEFVEPEMTDGVPRLSGTSVIVEAVKRRLS